MYTIYTMAFSNTYQIYNNKALSLDSLCIHNEPSTFILKVENSDSNPKFLHEGDLLIVDRSITPKNNSLVVVDIDGQSMLSRILINRGKIYITSSDPRKSPLLFNESEDSTNQIWGVVTYVLRKTY